MSFEASGGSQWKECEIRMPVAEHTCVSRVSTDNDTVRVAMQCVSHTHPTCDPPPFTPKASPSSGRFCQPHLLPAPIVCSVTGMYTFCV